MKFSKNSCLRAIGLLLFLTSSTQNRCHEVKEIKGNMAKIGYEHPYLPGTIGALALTKFFKEKPFKRFAAFASLATAGTFFCQYISESYLKKNLNCFEWMTFKTPTFKAKTDELHKKIRNFFN